MYVVIYVLFCINIVNIYKNIKYFIFTHKIYVHAYINLVHLYTICINWYGHTHYLIIHYKILLSRYVFSNVSFICKKGSVNFIKPLV